MRKFAVVTISFIVFFTFLTNKCIYSYDSQEKRYNTGDTTAMENIIGKKLNALEELIDEEILISEFYGGKYKLVLKKAIDFAAHARNSYEIKSFDKALEKIELSQGLANRVLDMANGEPHDRREKLSARKRQLEKLLEYSNKLYFNKNDSNASASLKELFAQGKRSFEKANSEIKRKEYVAALESVSFASDCLLGAMKICLDELPAEIDELMKERFAELNDAMKEGIEIIPQSGSEDAKWCFTQSMKYRDMAEKVIRVKKFSQAYEMVQLGIGYCSWALQVVKSGNKGTDLTIPSRSEQERRESLIERRKSEQEMLEAYEGLLKMKDRLSYQDSLIDKTKQVVSNGSSYILKKRLNRLLDFRQRAEIASLLEEYDMLHTYQFLIAKISHNILELSSSE